MTIIEAFILFTTMAALAALPSASVALVIARAIAHGRSHGIAASAGVVAGDLIFISMTMLGLTLIAGTLGSAFMLVKVLGAAYLLWLGVTMLKSTSLDQASADMSVRKSSLVASFLAGLVLTLGDLKAVFFYLSLLPLFMDLSAPTWGQVTVVVICTIVAVGGTKVIYVIFAHRLVSLAKGSRINTLPQKTAGAALVAAGSYIIVKA
ncbi:MAG: LysE family translocator [Pseudomonadota bacterium]